jgi:hypothetical protein
MKNLLKSLAAFQQECPVIHKGTSGYSYTYADLPAIFEVVNPLLSKHNLGFTQLIDGKTSRLSYSTRKAAKHLKRLQPSRKVCN